MNRCNFHRLSPSRIVRGDSAAPCKKKRSATAAVPSVSTRPAIAPVAGMTVASATAPIISSKKGSVFFKATTFPVQCRCCDVGQGSEASSHWSANWSAWLGTGAIASADRSDAHQGDVDHIPLLADMNQQVLPSRIIRLVDDLGYDLGTGWLKWQGDWNGPELRHRRSVAIPRITMRPCFEGPS